MFVKQDRAGAKDISWKSQAHVRRRLEDKDVAVIAIFDVPDLVLGIVGCFDRQGVVGLLASEAAMLVEDAVGAFDVSRHVAELVLIDEIDGDERRRSTSSEVQ